MYKWKTALVVLLISSLSLSAQLVQNGQFEDWTNGIPDYWSINPSGLVISQVTGLDGTGSAVKLQKSGGDSGAALKAGLTTYITDTFYIQFDFKYGDPGSNRGINVTCKGGDDWTSCMNIITLDSTINFYNGSAWTVIPGTEGQVPPGDIYRLTVEGQWNGDYNVSVKNLSTETDIVTNVTVAHWQSERPDFREIRLDRGRSGNDWICDNLIVSAQNPRIPSVQLSNALVTLPENTLTLNPTVFDTDNTPDQLTYLWEVIDGPSASFSDTSDPCAVVTFSSKGIYTLQLTATDPDNQSGQATMLVNVKDNSDDVLLARYNFEDAISTTTVADTTGALGNTFADDGLFGFTADEPNFAEGWVGSQAIQMGNTAIIDIPNYEDNGDPNIANLEWEVSVSAWVLPSEDNTYSYTNIISRAMPFIWGLRQRDSGVAEFTVGLDTGVVFGTGTKLINDGYWHHLVGTFNSDEISLYVDGVLDVTIPAKGLLTVDPAGATTIGNRPDIASQAWGGLIDDLRIYSFALPYDNGEHSVVGLAKLGTNVIPSVDIDEENPDILGTDPAMPLVRSVSSSTPLYASVVDLNNNLAGALWTVVDPEQAGDVTFDDASAVNTVASFAKKGTYTLQLQVWDDAGAGIEGNIYDQITIYVDDPTCADLLTTLPNGRLVNLYATADISGPEGTPDCAVNLYDLATLASEWMMCNDPQNAECENPFGN